MSQARHDLSHLTRLVLPGALMLLAACTPVPETAPNADQAADHAADQTAPQPDAAPDMQMARMQDQMPSLDEVVENTPAAPVDNCALEVERPWTVMGQPSLTLTATTRCEDEQTIVDLSIHNPAGERLYEAVFFPDDVMVLAGLPEGESLAPSLEFWLGGHTPFSSTADLPEFNAPAEFPFLPDTENGAEYERWRKGGYPVRCFVQGMESQICLAQIDGQIVSLGLQLFPG